MTDRERREWAEANTVAGFCCIVSVIVFFLIMPASDAVHATALLFLVAFAASGFSLLAMKLLDRSEPFRNRRKP